MRPCATKHTRARLGECCLVPDLWKSSSFKDFFEEDRKVWREELRPLRINALQIQGLSCWHSIEADPGRLEKALWLEIWGERRSRITWDR